MPNFVVLGCLEVGEKFTVGWGRVVGHFDTNYQVTPTFVRLGRAVTTILAEFRGGEGGGHGNGFNKKKQFSDVLCLGGGMAIDNIAENTSTYLNLTLAKYVPSLV